MAFIKRDFDTRISIAKDIEPKKVIVIACEDENVQPTYFNIIKEVFKIPTITEVYILPCINGKSAPEHLCNNLKKYIDENKNKYDFDERDEFWIVIDRESPTHVCHEKLLTKLKDCEDFGNNFKVGVTNPLFELWLLLHVDDLSNYNQAELFENKKVSISKRFIDKKLSELLAGYSKEKRKINKIMRKIVNKSNIQKAIKQEGQIENDFNKIISNQNLGSNIGILVQSILEDII